MFQINIPVQPFFKSVWFLCHRLETRWGRWGMALFKRWRDFQQCGILTSVDSYKHVLPPFKLRNSKWCSVSRLTVKKYSSDKQRLWSDCAYAQADLRLWWSHIPHCWKFHATAHLLFPSIWPGGDKMCLRGFWHSKTKISLLSYRD